MDGINIFGNRGKLKQRPLFWHYPHYSNQGGNPGSAVRMGEFKLIDDFETGRQELYNLNRDLEESHNLAEDLPSLKDSLYHILAQWRHHTGALMMEEN
jgi:arylsulfatase A